MTHEPTDSAPHSAPAAAVEHLFERVVCAVDGSPDSAEAARQADALMPPGRTLELVTVVREATLDGGWGEGFSLSPGSWPEHLDPALRALPEGRPVEVSPIYRSGPLGPALVDELAERHATLVALAGSHRHALPHFLDGLVHDGVVGQLVHDAPCSLLIARPDEGAPRRLAAIAAGLDGSTDDAAALRTAEALASRLGATLTVVAADSATVPEHAAVSIVEAAHATADATADALAETDADLLVLGCPRRHGVHAHGSIGERVVERSGASVLLLRD